MWKKRCLTYLVLLSMLVACSAGEMEPGTVSLRGNYAFRIEEGWWIVEDAAAGTELEPIRYEVDRIESEAPVYCIIFDHARYWENALRKAHESLPEKQIEDMIAKSQTNYIEAVLFSSAPFKVSFKASGQFVKEGNVINADDGIDGLAMETGMEDIRETDIEGGTLYYHLWGFDFCDQDVSRLETLMVSSKRLKIFEYDKRFEDAYDKEELIYQYNWDDWVVSECFKDAKTW